MRTRMRATAALLATLPLAASACGHDTTAPGPALDGDWGPATTLVGSRWTMHLATHGDAVSGTGSYAFEAGRVGTFAVTGATAGERVTLDIAYDYGPRDHFEGVHTPLDVLHGRVTRTDGGPTFTTDTDYYRRGAP